MPTSSPTPGLLVINRWLVALFTVLMVVTAALAGNGLFRSGTEPWLITGHMHLGNLLFFLAVVQLVICYALFSQKHLAGSVAIVSGLVLILTFGQIGLGYMTRTNMLQTVGWHIALGVSLTATTAVLATMLWLKPRPSEG